MRSLTCVALVFVGCSSSTHAVFRPTDPSFQPNPGAAPKVYDQSNVMELEHLSLRSVGQIEISVPESSGKGRVLELAVEKGRTLGCWVLVEHSAFNNLKASLDDGARVMLAHNGGHEAAPSALKAAFDCVLKTQT